MIPPRPLLVGPVRLEATGDRPLGEVWEDYTTPAKWSSWAPQITGVEAPPGRIEAGTKGVVRGPVGLRVPFVVRSIDDASRQWSWAPGAGPFRVRMRHGVEQVAGRTRAWVEIDLPPVLAVPYAPIAQLALRRLVRS